jgi:AmiR/NasT family two-component response regulator
MKSLDILIAEDESIQALGLKRRLEKMNHKITGTARDGFEAVKLASKLKPDLILMDIKMPKLDGIEAAKRINQERVVPIIIITAYSDEKFIEGAKEAGVTAYLLKPIDEKDLAPAIEIAYGTFEKIDRLTGEVKDLKVELKNRKLIERAKGILMEKLQISEREAMTRLQKESTRLNRKLAEVAESIVITSSIVDKESNP